MGLGLGLGLIQPVGCRPSSPARGGRESVQKDEKNNPFDPLKEVCIAKM